MPEATTPDDTVVMQAPTRARAGRPLQIVPWLSAEAGYSDNVSQAPKGHEKSGAYERVVLGVTTNYSQPRFEGTATVGVEASHYSGASGVDATPFASAAGTANVVRNRLYVDMGADYMQSAHANVKDGYLKLRDNKDGIGRAYISPYWQQPLGHSTMAELRYSHEHLFSTSSGIDTQYTDGAALTLAHGSLSSRWSAEAMASYDRTNTDGKYGDYAVASGVVTGRYGVSRTVSVLGRTGYDRVIAKDYPDGSSAIAEAGLMWNPSARTSMSFLAGWRFNDWSLEANARHALGRSVVVGAGLSQFISSGSKTAFRDPRMSGANMLGSTANDRAKDNNLGAVNAMRDGAFETGDTSAGLAPANSAIRNRVYTGNGKSGTYKSTMGTVYATGAFDRRTQYLLQGTAEYQKYFNTKDNVYTAYAGVLHQLTGRLGLSADLMFQSAGTNQIEQRQYVGMAGIGLGYALARNADVTLRLTRTQNFGGDSHYRFVEHALTAGVNASF